MNEAIDSSKRLTPHTYPLFFKIVLLLSLIFFIYFCLIVFPRYYHCYRKLYLAHKAFDLENYSLAYEQYKELLNEIIPSREMRIKLAQSCFALNKSEEALNILNKLSLTPEDWEELNKYSSKRYELKVSWKEKI